MNTKASKTRKAAVVDPFAEKQGAPATDLVQQAQVPDAATTPIVKALTELTTEAGKVTGLLARGRELRDQYKDVVFDVTTAKGMRDATEARRLLRAEARFPLQHLQEDVSKQLGTMQRQWNNTLREYITEIEGYETPIDQQITAHETREKARKEAHEKGVLEIQRMPESAIGMDSESIDLIITGLDAMDLTKFEEYREAAAGAQVQTLGKLRVLRDNARAAEEQRRDQARKDAIGAKIDAIVAIGTRLPMCRTAERVQALIDEAAAVVIDVATFQEFVGFAQTARDQLLTRLREAHAAKVAAEAPKPTPAPTPAPSPAPQQQSSDPIGDKLRDLPVAGTLHSRGGPGSGRFHFEPNPGYLPREQASIDPAADMQIDNTPAVAPATEATIRTERPTDAEILHLIAEHYDVEPVIAAAWLHNFDADSAIAQQSLIPTTA